MAIRFLEDHLINQIAAGEVVENPASVVKELVENALDAHPQTITISLQQGGQALISVSDDGQGMTPEDLNICVERYATSKLATDTLHTITSYGFRGEALAALGAVARLRIRSRTARASTGQNSEEGWMIDVQGGVKQAPMPTVCPVGTHVEVRDLFYATPARLKFMKSPLQEGRNIRMIFERLALSAPTISFILQQEGKKNLDLPARATWQERAADILGSTFHQQAVPLLYEDQGYCLEGLAGLPTFHSSHSLHQLFFVNNRPVKDKILQALLRASYGDSLPAGRHPQAVLFLTLPLEDLDVNVHPAKTEVRFRDIACLKHLVLSGLRKALSPSSDLLRPASLPTRHFVPKEHLSSGYSTSQSWAPHPTLSQKDSDAESLNISLAESPESPKNYAHFSVTSVQEDSSCAVLESSIKTNTSLQGNLIQSRANFSAHSADSRAPTLESLKEPPLGLPIGQLHQAYILSQTQEGFLIIDQHAAHERIVFETLKKTLREGRLASLGLLIPEVAQSSPACYLAFNQHAEFLKRIGFLWEFLSEDTLVIRAIPALLEGVDVTHLIRDFDLYLSTAVADAQNYMEECLKTLSAPLSCRGSIKAGRKLTFEEMDTLLRHMEKTPNYGHCTHGRPTIFALSRTALDQLFQRH